MRTEAREKLTKLIEYYDRPHVFTLNHGTAKGMEGWIWFLCPCGAAGPKAKNEIEAQYQWEEHQAKCRIELASAEAGLQAVMELEKRLK